MFTSSQTPESPTPPAPSWAVGDHTVRRVDEVLLPAGTGPWLLPGATPDLVGRSPWLSPEFADGQGVLRLASHSFAVEADGMRVLVDTGIGNGKRRANPAWHDLNSDYEARLRAAGFAPESVDLVILTHLHADHVGWNTRADGDAWVPTFPNARYLTSRTEWDHWAGVDMEEARRQMFRDSVHPVREAGLLDLVDVADEGTDVAPGVRLLPTPGHTPGQVAVALSSLGESALITGDSIHHPVQMAHPELCSCVDVAPGLAARTRNRLLDSLAGTSTLLLGSHFPAPTAGHVRREDGRYRLVPASSRVTRIGG
ncbi:MBL fold metallo-hydrolase [Streptomyces sp. NPDC101133]|uniref:MBL fold metallo-hydrolase n=1 Tax=Streptomyces sp. NPDC101133 TaxID=3366111 RepID=UPI00381CE6CB